MPQHQGSGAVPTPAGFRVRSRPRLNKDNKRRVRHRPNGAERFREVRDAEPVQVQKRDIDDYFNELLIDLMRETLKRYTELCNRGAASKEQLADAAASDRTSPESS